ncbi:MAG: hypothetical protein IJ774_13805 [Selenomonadaceae bacterium]|nr:hypothetical protein [Selenomonadaceae bacterium]MBR1807448.1 hypothetical protein [Selenomonadaceae bacterium]
MHESVKNLSLKDYNPCGELTGVEREICDEATKNFPNLPFSEVMRTVAVKFIAELERKKFFPNEAALVDWSLHELNQVEWHVVVQFGDSSPLEVGLSKYLAHVLYENRYNVHYNALVNYCRTLDEKVFAADLTSEQLEQKIDSLAKEADYSTKVNDLIEQLHNFIKGSGSICLADIVTTIFDVFT